MFPPEFQQLTYLQTKLANKLGQYLVETVVPSWVYSRAASLTCSVSVCHQRSVFSSHAVTAGPVATPRAVATSWGRHIPRSLRGINDDQTNGDKRQRDHGSLSAPSDTQTQQESPSSIDMDRTYLPIEIFGLPITKS